MNDILAEAAGLGPWHHDVDIGPGMRTGSVATSGEVGDTVSLIRPLDALKEVIAPLYGEGGLAGRTFLDCACNGGGYVLAAKALGASSAFGFDARDHWIRQANFLKRACSVEDVSFEAMELRDLPKMQLAQFDVTLFSGLLYHLPDPVDGLRIAADHTREILIVNTAFHSAKPDGLVLLQESRTHLMSGVDGLAWMPTSPAVVGAMLAWCGLPEWRLFWKSSASRGRGRMIVVGARSREAFRHFDERTNNPPAHRWNGLMRRLFDRR
jgi:SAM-dependent methyltransferase